MQNPLIAWANNNLLHIIDNSNKEYIYSLDLRGDTFPASRNLKDRYLLAYLENDKNLLIVRYDKSYTIVRKSDMLIYYFGTIEGSLPTYSTNHIGYYNHYGGIKLVLLELPTRNIVHIATNTGTEPIKTFRSKIYFDSSYSYNLDIAMIEIYTNRYQFFILTNKGYILGDNFEEVSYEDGG